MAFGPDEFLDQVETDLFVIEKVFWRPENPAPRATGNPKGELFLEDGIISL